MSTQTPSPKILERALGLSLSVALVHFILSTALILVGIQHQDNNILFFAGIALAIALMGVIVTASIRRGENTKSIWLLIGIICLGFPLLSLTIQGLGWLILAGVPVLIILLALRTLPRRQAFWAAGMSLISGFAGWWIDINIQTVRSTLLINDLIFPVSVLSFLALTIYLISIRFSRFSLRTKLLILFLGVALVPMIIMNIINARSNQNSLTAAANLSLSSVAEQTSQEIDSFIQETIVSLENQAQLIIFKEALTATPDIYEILETDVLQTIQVLMNENPDYLVRYDLINREGVHISGFPRLSQELSPFLGLNPSLVNSLKVSLFSALPYVSPVILEPGTGTPILYFTSVVTTRDGRPLGMLVVTYEAAILQNIVEERNNSAGEASYGILYDENHIQLAHGLFPETNFKTLVPLNDTILETMKASNRLPDLAPHLLTQNWLELENGLKNSRKEPNFALEASGSNQEDSQVAVQRLSSRPWNITFFQPQDNFLDPVERQTRFNIILGLVFAGIITIVAIGSSSLIGAPISNLSQVVEHISNGDLSIRVPVTTQDEIGKLASTFNSMTAQIQTLLAGLEAQVADRTEALERRAVQLQTAAEVAREASQVQDLDTLLSEAVDLISQAFGFYHAGIFLIDDNHEFAILRAANSEGGKLMLAQGHKLKIGQVGIVGDTTQTGQPHIALDVGQDRAHFAHSYLPDTHSEMALPLKIGDEIIGALDVQSKASSAFDDEDINILQVLADQLAVAIQNSQLLNEVQQTVQELQAAYGEFTQRSWRGWSEGQISGYRYQNSRIEPILRAAPDTSLLPEDGHESASHSPSETTIAIPLKLRDTSLGVIKLTVNSGQVSDEMVSLVTDIGERLVLALENARLLESSRQRAAQEQLVSQITTRMRETLDLETILKTAAEEIQTALELPEVVIRLGEHISDTGSRS